MEFRSDLLQRAREQKYKNINDLLLDMYKIKGVKKHRNTVQGWEEGRVFPRVDELLLMAEMLLKPISFFFANKSK